MDCISQEPEQTLDDWGQTVLKRLAGKRYPIGGQFELTDRCNLSCVHCYINQPAGCQAARSKELSTDQVFYILDEIAKAGCLFLLLTGGEPLLRPDFKEIYMYARGRGLVVTLFTNATLMTEEIADMLAYAQPQMVDITLYGATRETYESVTQVKGSFERCMRGIQMLKDRNVRLALKSILLTKNRHELDAMRKFAESLGVELRYDGVIWPRLDGNLQTFEYRLSIDEMLALDRDTPERLAEWKKRADEFKDVTVRNEYVFSCGAGLRSFHINSRGEMSICTMVSKPTYNLFEMSFSAAWEKIGQMRHWKRELHTECETCKVGALCVQCPGWSQMVHDDNETPVDFICQLGYARHRQLNLDMIK